MDGLVFDTLLYFTQTHTKKADETHQDWVLLNGIEQQCGIGKHVTNSMARGIYGEGGREEGEVHSGGGTDGPSYSIKWSSPSFVCFACLKQMDPSHWL